MKPLYILDRYDGSVRRERATPSEIRDVISGRRNDRLARVEIGEEGDLVTHELTADELAAISSELDADVARRMHATLDAAAALARQARDLSGVQLGSFGVLTIWVENAVGAERAALEWAELRGYEVRHSSPPRDRKSWYPDATIHAESRDLVRIVWPEIEVNTEKAIDTEHGVGGLAAGLASFSATEPF